MCLCFLCVHVCLCKSVQVEITQWFRLLHSKFTPWIILSFTANLGQHSLQPRHIHKQIVRKNSSDRRCQTVRIEKIIAFMAPSATLALRG